MPQDTEANVIRIYELRAESFEVVIINKSGIYNQGPALTAKTPAQAYQWAIAMLPTKQTERARWEYRSEHGVYANLDIAKLGWC